MYKIKKNLVKMKETKVKMKIWTWNMMKKMMEIKVKE